MTTLADGVNRDYETSEKLIGRLHFANREAAHVCAGGARETIQSITIARPCGCGPASVERDGRDIRDDGELSSFRSLRLWRQLPSMPRSASRNARHRDC
jgi:hypothetical protein